jgi:hypothetical protein
LKESHVKTVQTQKREFATKMKFKGFNDSYVNIRRFFGLVCEEYEPFKIILTRALGICRLTDRIIGFQLEEENSKCSTFDCRNRTNLYAVVQNGKTKKLYLLPICHYCIEKGLARYVDAIVLNMRKILSKPKYLAQII